MTVVPDHLIKRKSNMEVKADEQPKEEASVKKHERKKTKKVEEPVFEDPTQGIEID